MALDSTLSKIIASLRNATGEEFFNTLTQQLHDTIGADYTFIARLHKQQGISTTISLVAQGAIAENFSYDLKDTPCADVSQQGTCIYPNDICQLYPKDQLLIDMSIEGYVGAPLHASNGEILGLVVALYEKPIVNANLVKDLFELFSGRIAAEIERVEQTQAMQALNQQLEHIVAERTEELQQSLDDLKLATDNMVEQEKLSALGSMVAGVAHEINTPLGVGILSCTHILDLAADLDKKVNDQTLSKAQLVNAIFDIRESADSLFKNLQRAADLISNFKQVAVERSVDGAVEVDLNSWLKSQIVSISPLLKAQNIQLEVEYSQPNLLLYTWPAKLSQVIVNIIKNAAMHAFDDGDIETPTVFVKAWADPEQCFISVRDNGVGMDKTTLGKMFEPFFTTKRNKGGTGLGLSIVHSLIKGALGGDLKVQSKPMQGTEFIIMVPIGNEHQ